MKSSAHGDTLECVWLDTAFFLFVFRERRWQKRKKAVSSHTCTPKYRQKARSIAPADCDAGPPRSARPGSRLRLPRRRQGRIHGRRAPRRLQRDARPRVRRLRSARPPDSHGTAGADSDSRAAVLVRRQGASCLVADPARNGRQARDSARRSARLHLLASRERQRRIEPGRVHRRQFQRHRRDGRVDRDPATFDPPCRR